MKKTKLTDREEWVLRLHYDIIHDDEQMFYRKPQFRTPQFLSRIFELPFKKIVKIENKAIQKLGKGTWMEVSKIRIQPISKQEKLEKIRDLLKNFL